MNFKYKTLGNGLVVGFGNVLDNLLKLKGINSPKDFLNLGEHNIENYKLFDNIDKAIECFDKHIKNNSKILVVKDEDLDGVTSSAMIYNYTKRLFPNVNLEYTMHKKKVHGLSEDIMKTIEEGKYDLVILPDASSNDFDQHGILKVNNIDVLVLDHHETTHYSEHAIVVNNQLSSKITNKSMTGVGVVFKFCKALDEFYNVNYADNYLDLLAVGMIADSCDLKNLESRYLVLKGLKLIENKENKNTFISKLIEKQAYSMKNKVTIMGVAFYISPLVNSVIRSGTFEDNIDLFKAFIGVDESRVTKIRGKGEVELSIEDYAVRLCESNKRLQNKIVDKSVGILDTQIKDYSLNNNAILILNGTDVEQNYTGLIANKIASRYQKPCLLLKPHEDTFSGSGRGYSKKYINDLKQWCNETGLFNYASGHANAMGVSVPKDNINKLYEIVGKLPNDDTLIYDVDAILNDRTFNKIIVETIGKYNDIWGNGISEPLFALENIIIESKDIQLLGSKKNTIKFTYKGVDFVKFNSSEEIYNKIIENETNRFIIIGRFSTNEYNGNITPQVLIEDFNYEISNTVQKFKF